MAESHRRGLILFLLFIILFIPDGAPPNQRGDTEAALAQEKKELDELRNSTYGIPGNITGLQDVGKKGSDGSVIVMPPVAVRNTVKELISSIMPHSSVPVYSGPDESKLKNSTAESEPEPAKGGKSSEVRTGEGNNRKSLTMSEIGIPNAGIPLYHNATGHIRGHWRRLYDLPPYKPVDPGVHFEKNITSDSGKLYLWIGESKPGDVQEVEARLSLKDEDGWHLQETLLNGVHFTKSGEMVLTTTSRNFSGIFALPHFTLDEEEYKRSKPSVIESIAEAIRNQEESTDGNLPWPPTSGSDASPRCEYIAYFQLHPVESKPPVVIYPRYDPRAWLSWFWGYPPITPEILEQIEQELRYHTGAPLPPAPPIILSGIVYSPTCGFVLEMKEVSGLKTERYHDKIAIFALTASLIIGFQTWILIRQMNESNTPSTLSRVSFWSIAMMAVLDGYMASAFIFFSIIVKSTYLQLLTAAFFSFILVVVFGMRFLLTIWIVQRPERRAAQQAAAAAASNPNTNSNLPEATLPAPVTAATAQTPLIPPESNNNNVNATTTAVGPNAENDERQDLSILYPRFYFVLLGGSILFIYVSSWPPFARHIFIDVASFIACSFWVPQIYRNVMRGCRKALSWEFIIGTSICRLTSVLYLFFVKENIFYYNGDWRVGLAAAAWLWTQIFLLGVQEMFGARLFVPRRLLPPAYDYHPILPIDDLEAAQPFSASSPSSASHAHSGLRTFDCAICMHAVQVSTIASTSVNADRGDRGRGASSSAAASLGLLSRRSYMVTPCRHVFHSVCLEGWMRYRLQCPICRNQLPPL